MKKILIIIVLILYSCAPQIRTIEKVRIDTFKVVSPTIEDTLKANIIKDTVIIANKIKEKDTVIIAKYFPVEKKFYIKAKPDTVTLFKIDTVSNVKIIEKDSFEAIDKIILLLPFVYYLYT
jgi:hypothetical protein